MEQTIFECESFIKKLASSSPTPGGGGAAALVGAVAAALAIIVMYDALGVRRQAGEQAKVLNEMIEVFEKMGKDITPEDRLKEFVGHTPFQVFVGAIIGILMGVLMNNVIIPMI